MKIRIHRCVTPLVWFGLGVAALLILPAAPYARAQGKQGPPGGMPPTPVRFTEAKEHNVRRTLVLPGSVEALTTSTIASTVDGVVVEFLAREGRRVKTGDVLARQRSTTLELRLEAQRASLKEAQARLKLAESNLTRARELFQAGVISRQQYDDAQSEFTAWQGRSESLQADIARLEDDIDRCRVRAPFDGVVVRERTEVGQWLAVGAPVADLVAINQVEIRVDVPERHFPDLRVGATAAVTFEALPGFRTQGRIIALVPRADPQARTFPIKVRVPNEHGRIGVGMLAQVSFPAGEVYRATVVPKDAVVRRGPREIVYRLNGDNTVEEVAVETGTAVGVWVEVRSWLRAGDKVVTRGNERLRPGQPVQPTPIAYERPS